MIRTRQCTNGETCYADECTHAGMCMHQDEALDATPQPRECRCVRCAECSGSGRVDVRTGGYPETDIETCSECRGTGISEMCSGCELAQELTDALERP